MQIDKKRTDAQWCQFDDDTSVELQIRPFPFGAGKSYVADEDGLSKSMWHQFEYSLQGWKGITGENGDEFAVSDENKKFLFDFVEEIRSFVFIKSRELALKIADSSKN